MIPKMRRFLVWATVRSANRQVRLHLATMSTSTAGSEYLSSFFIRSITAIVAKIASGVDVMLSPVEHVFAYMALAMATLILLLMRGASPAWRSTAWVLATAAIVHPNKDTDFARPAWDYAIRRGWADDSTMLAVGRCTQGILLVLVPLSAGMMLYKYTRIMMAETANPAMLRPADPDHPPGAADPALPPLRKRQIVPPRIASKPRPLAPGGLDFCKTTSGNVYANVYNAVNGNNVIHARTAAPDLVTQDRDTLYDGVDMRYWPHAAAE